MKYIFTGGMVLVFGLLSFAYVEGAAAYPTADAARQAIFSAHVRAFSVDNLLKNSISKDGAESWYGALSGTDGYINNVLAKSRTIPISKANKELFARAMNLLQGASNDLINTVKILHNANYGFKEDKYADINIDQVKEQLAKLALRVPELQKLQQDLAPGTFDIQDTKDVKKLLKDALYALELTYKKVSIDFDKIKAGIRFAIDKKKYGAGAQ